MAGGRCEDGDGVTIVVWLTEGTWPACVDAARALPADPVRLLHVVDAHSVEAIDGAHAGLLGRAAGAGGAEMLRQAQTALLDAAAARLGRPAERVARRGAVEREVVAACADADLLILARDGDRTRLGPKSLGRTTRFVLDHAPCPVLLVWPDAPPGLSTLPPPPR
jgi:nucleotide-binding universal stress UspA family protein